MAEARATLDGKETELAKAEIHRQVIGQIDLSLIGTMGEGDLRLEIRRAAEQIALGRGCAGEGPAGQQVVKSTT